MSLQACLPGAVLLVTFLADEVLQAVAAEDNLSQTALLLSGSLAGPGHDDAARSAPS